MNSKVLRCFRWNRGRGGSWLNFTGATDGVGATGGNRTALLTPALSSLKGWRGGARRACFITSRIGIKLSTLQCLATENSEEPIQKVK